MSVHLQRELNRLKTDLLANCAIVEEQVHLAVQAVLRRDEEAARKVERRDAEVDRREVDIEERCLGVLALYQPVAGDLRMVVAVLKINNDLERIGDLAVNIAHKALALCKEPVEEAPAELEAMAQRGQQMLRDAIDAMVNLDAALAHDVCRRDDEVDEMKRAIRCALEDRILREPELTRPLMRLLAVSRNIERIADCATNIAEDVIYVTQGRIVRHGEGD